MRIKYQAIIGKVRDREYLESSRGWCDLNSHVEISRLQASIPDHGGRIIAHKNTSLTSLNNGKRLTDVGGRTQEKNLIVTIDFEEECALTAFEDSVRNRGYVILDSKTKQEQAVA